MVDSLIDAASIGTGNVAQAWQAVLRRIEADAPAVFMYAPTYLAVVDRRFGNVRIRPESPGSASGMDRGRRPGAD